MSVTSVVSEATGLALHVSEEEMKRLIAVEKEAWQGVRAEPCSNVAALAHYRANLALARARLGRDLRNIETCVGYIRDLEASVARYTPREEVSHAA